MLKWIRPSGAIAFVVVILAIGVFWWMLADWLFKSSIELAGSKIVGARVELKSANLSFNPLGFRLDGLQVTNPKQPMQNMFQLDSAKGSLDLLHLLMGQVIIEEMSAKGVRLDTERKSSGEIKSSPTVAAGAGGKQQKAQQSSLNASAAKVKLPDVNEIIAKEPLATLDQIKTFREKSQSDRSTMTKNIAALPDEASLKQHENAIKNLTQGKIENVAELNQRKIDLDRAKVEIRKDRDAIMSMRDQLKNAKSDLAKRYDTLKSAPAEDWNRVKSRYGLNDAGAGNLAGLLFGDNAKIWVTRVLTWAEQVQKLLPSGGADEPKDEPPKRSSGRLIHFPTSNPLPDFLIRKAVLSMEVPAGAFDIQLSNVTAQPEIFGKPMRLFAEARKLSNAEYIKIDGVFDHVKPEQAKDSVNWRVNGVKLSKLSISKNAKLPIEISSSRANFSGDLVMRGQNIEAKAKSEFKEAVWNADKGKESESKLVSLITSIHDFDIDGKLSGKISSPQVSINSNMDDKLKSALSGKIDEAQAKLKKAFKARLDQEIQSVAGSYKDQSNFFDDQDKSLDQRIDKLNQLLSAKIKSSADQKKENAKDKLKGSAADKLKSLKF